MLLPWLLPANVCLLRTLWLIIETSFKLLFIYYVFPCGFVWLVCEAPRSARRSGLDEETPTGPGYPNGWTVGKSDEKYGGFLSHRGTHGYHPFFIGMFHEINYPFWVPPWLWNSPRVHMDDDWGYPHDKTESSIHAGCDAAWYMQL